MYVPCSQEAETLAETFESGTYRLISELETAQLVSKSNLPWSDMSRK